MKRRFEVTLLAVAIAVLAVAANAMAPTIFNIRSPVIGNEGVSAANSFVFPDALNADALATDPDGTVADEDIAWSYMGMTDRYRINDIDPIDIGGGDNPVAPGTKRIDTTDNDPSSVDSDPNTLTFRDATLSPIGGPDTFPATSGIVYSELVTLFASDGTTYSMKSFYVYTDNGGEDRLSGSTAQNLVSIDFKTESGAALGWTSTIVLGTPTLSDNANGLCIDAGAPANDAWGGWISPYGIFEMVSNSVFRIRMTVAGANQAAGTTPLWTVVLDNNNNTGTGDNKFGAEWLFLDNENGANSPGQGNRTEFLMYWNPLPINDSLWNDATSGMYTTARVSGGSNNARLQFRILDVNGAVPGGNLDGGQLCLTNLVIDKIDYSDLSSGTVEYEKATMTDPDFGLTPPTGAFGNTSSSFAGGSLTITPTNGNWFPFEVTVIDMGDTTADLGNPSTLIDNYPVVWETNQLLKTTLVATAPNATATTNPVDVIRLQNDTPTNEILMYNLVVSSVNTLGLPRQNNDMEYISFFYTHNKTTSSTAGLDRVRSRITMICSDAINSGGTAANNGGITFKSMKIENIQDPTL